MTDMPHVTVGDTTTEELCRITEAYLREHDRPVVGAVFTVDLCNKAIDWWNGLQSEAQRAVPAP